MPVGRTVEEVMVAYLTVQVEVKVEVRVLVMVLVSRVEASWAATAATRRVKGARNFIFAREGSGMQEPVDMEV